MKKIAVIIIMILVLSVSLFASYLEGKVNFGEYLNCVIQNNTGSDIIVQSISYLITIKDNKNKLKQFDVTTRCYFSCYLYKNESKRFKGPPNDPSIVKVECRIDYMPSD